MKTVTCECGFKFQVHENSRATTCWECLKKNKLSNANKGLKPLDRAFKKIDETLKRKPLK